MIEEEKMPTYGELYAENFRLEHNNRVLQERETQLKSVLKEIREYIEKSSLEVNTKEFGNLTMCNSDDLLEIIDKGIGEDK